MLRIRSARKHASKLSYIKGLMYFFVLELSFVSNASSQNSEQFLLLDNQTQAIYQPSVTQQTRASVIMIHGWTGTLNEVGNLYQRLARQLAELGIASLRVQIQGEHNQADFLLTSTFQSRIDDAQRGVDYLREHHPTLPLGVVGFSLGGATAIGLVNQNLRSIESGKGENTINDLTSVVLWSSVINPDEVERHYMTPELMQRLNAKGEVKVMTYQPFRLNKRHVLGLRGYSDLVEQFNQYQGALLMLRGSKDSVKRHEPAVFAKSKATPAEYRIIHGANHIFNVLDPNSTFDERLLDATIEWLQRTLQ